MGVSALVGVLERSPIPLKPAFSPEVMVSSGNDTGDPTGTTGWGSFGGIAPYRGYVSTGGCTIMITPTSGWGARNSAFPTLSATATAAISYGAETISHGTTQRLVEGSEKMICEVPVHVARRTDMERPTRVFHVHMHPSSGRVIVAKVKSDSA